jgi:soluble lytic murein transglycosylase-like protein
MLISMFMTARLRFVQHRYVGWGSILLLIGPAFAASPGAAQQGRVRSVVQADAATGRLVRTFVAAPRIVSKAQSTAEQAQFKEMVNRIAVQEGVETPLVQSVIRAESNYNPDAVSPKGAMGIMQLIPATAKRFGVSDAFDPEENIQGGVRYLKFLLDYYQGDYPRAIAAYNAGEAAVDKYHGIPPFAETQNYVVQVAKNLEAARQTPANAPTDVVSNIEGETLRPIQTSIGSDGRIYYRTP